MATPIHWPWDYDLSIIENVEIRGGGALLTGRRLAGSNPMFPPYERECTIEVLSTVREQGEVQLDLGAKFVSFGKALVRARCPACSHDRVLILDGSMHIDLDVGHRVCLSP